MCNKLPLKQSITEHSHAFQKRHTGMQETGGTQQTNVSQYVKSISNNFLYTLEAFFVNVELPGWKLLIFLNVLGELWVLLKF